MQYSKFQRFTSFFVLFFFLFSTTINFPISESSVYADDEWYKNIVSIIVDEDMYGSVWGSLSTYASNISKQLENTKVVILPTPSTASAYQIASLNESLYFEGLTTIDNSLKNWKLIGTVLVWNLNIPVAHENNDAQKTVVPYVDFEDKYFVYNHENWKFEKNESNINWLGVEVWHWVISPNLWSNEKNIKAINDYFSKNNDYYNSQGLFQNDKWVLNWDLNSWIPEDYKPYVFYFDQIRETKAINLESYSAYQAFQENKEDIIYKRYNQELADRIKERILWAQDDSLETLQWILWDSIDLSGGVNWPDMLNIPDIQTRHIINKSTKKFAEIFSKWSIGELRKDVHNAWRYNYPTNKVNVDFIPYLVTILDSVNDEIIKEANDDLEDKIDELVKNGLSRDIAIPTKFVNTIDYRDSIINTIPKTCYDTDGNPYNCDESEDVSQDNAYWDHYTNIYFGTQAVNVTLPEQCTIYRGSRYNTWTIVRANRSYNVDNIQWDIDRLNSKPWDDIDASECLAAIESWVWLNGYYWRNTGLYLDKEKSESWELILKSGFDENWALIPLFDIKWSKSINETWIKEPSYLNCLDSNYYLSQINEFKDNGARTWWVETTYQTPIYWNAINWTCKTSNPKHWYNETYDDLYKAWKCRDLLCIDGKKTINFKQIPSYMEHKAPTVNQLWKEIQAWVTPSLPIDRDRYIDFMANDDSYQKINYEYLFRNFKWKTFDEIKKEIENKLNVKSNKLNNLSISTEKEYSEMEKDVRETFTTWINDIQSSISQELDFDDTMTSKWNEISSLWGNPSNSSEDEWLISQDKEKLIEQSQDLKVNTVDLISEKNLFINLRDELIVKKNTLLSNIQEYDLNLTNGKYCKSWDCTNGWLSIVDKKSLDYQMSIINDQIEDYNEYINKLDWLIFKLEIQKREMDVLSLKMKVQLENLSQLWSTLEYDKNGISPIYEELNQRIKELDATEKSYEITDKTKEIQDRIDYLFSIIDTLNITKEEEDIVFISESLKNNNENIIWLYESKEADILFSEFDDINANLNDLLDLETELSQKKLRLANSIKNISWMCKSDEEWNVNKEKCKQVFEKIEELKNSEYYIDLQQEITNLENTISSKNWFLSNEYVLWTTSNISKLVEKINLEKLDIETHKRQFDIDSLNVNVNLDSINNWLHSVNEGLKSSIVDTIWLLKSVEKINDEIDDINIEYENKSKEIKLIDDNIVITINGVQLYLSTNDIDGNPYLELYDSRNNLLADRDVLLLKENELDWIITRLKSKRSELSTQILKLKAQRVKYLNASNLYDTKKEDRKIYKCDWDACSIWISEESQEAINYSLEQINNIIEKYEIHITSIDNKISSINTAEISIDENINNILNEINSIDTYLLELRKNDQEYKIQLLEDKQTSFIQKHSITTNHSNKVNDLIEIFEYFTEQKDTNDNYIWSFRVTSIENRLAADWYDDNWTKDYENYFTWSDIKTANRQDWFMSDGITPRYVFDYYYITRTTLLTKLDTLNKAKWLLDARVVLSSNYLSDISDKLWEKKSEINNISNLLSEISNNNSQDVTVRNNIQTLLDFIKLDSDWDWNSHVDFSEEKISLIETYFSELDTLESNINDFFIDKLVNDLIVPDFSVLSNLTRTSYYLWSPAWDFTGLRNSISSTSILIINKINLLHWELDDIFSEINLVLNNSNDIWFNIYEWLNASLDSINNWILSEGHFIYKKSVNFNINKQLNNINTVLLDIKSHIDNSNDSLNSIYKTSRDLWISLVWIEDYNNNQIQDYSDNNIQANITKVDEINATEFYWWSKEEENIWIIWDWWKWGNLDIDNQAFNQTIEDRIVDLRATEIYEDFRTAEEHPEWDIDLYEFLNSKETKTLKIWSDEKEITYIDSLAFAIYWNNLNSVSAKYKFVFENYLHDQFINVEDKNALPEEKYNFPKNKKQYEIAYLWAYWDAENMYIQMNPESKGDNPYKDIVQKNASLQSKLLWQNIGGSNWMWGNHGNNDEPMFKCAPPEWVPIFEWIPAIVCWLDDMLPPTITVSDSTCGPTLPLLSNEDKEYLEQCNWDVDKNGVNDCLENKLENWGVKSYSDSNRVYYNKPGTLKAKLFDESDNTLTFDNNTKVTFDIIKIEVPADRNKEFNSANKEVVYEIWDDEKIAKKYINFSSTDLSVKAGVVETQFTSKGFDANYYFQASINIKDANGWNAILKESDVIKIEVRGDRLFSTAYVIEENVDNWSIEANIWNNEITVSESSQIFIVDKNNTQVDDVKKLIYSTNNNLNKVVVSLNNISKSGNTLSLAYPLDIKIIDDYGKAIVDTIWIDESQLKSYYQLPGITKAWSYTLEIKDSNGYISKKQFDFVSEVAEKLEVKLWATVIESDWATTSNVITILDKFDNPVIGKTNTLDIDINWNSLVFEHNNDNNSSSQVIEGYKIFRLKSLNKIWSNDIDISLKDYFGNELLKQSLNIKVVENINLEIISNPSIKVWWDTYTLQAKIVWEWSQDFNSRVYFNINNLYWFTTQPYFDVINWVANIELQTTTLAGPDVPVELQVEWLNKIFSETISINHDTPEYLQLWMDQYWVQASEWSIANVEVYLKDQYGNIAFNQESWFVALEILPEYEKYITKNWPANINKWVAILKIWGTDLPWMAYFKVSYNWFDAVWKLNSYYYWNDSVISDTSYNALYTTLLWAPYGDITKENYLAGSLLFNDNKSLTVTSLLNSPYSHNDVVMVDSKWWIKSIAKKSDLSTDMSFTVNIENNKLWVAVKNNALWNYIWRIQPVLWWDTQLQVCKSTNDSINKCLTEDNLENTTIVLSSSNSDYEVLSNNSELFLQDKYGRKIFSVDRDGNIIRDWKISFELETNTNDYLQIWIYKSGQKIWTMLYSIVWAEVKSTRNKDLFRQTTTAVSNTILILLSWGSYASRDVYSNGHNNKAIYFNSPFDVDNQLNDFSKWNMSAYENFAEKKWLWWSEWNKSLLQFSSWENVWESVKAYQSFGVINLWDPVVSLKKIQRVLPKKTDTLRNFDSTLGKSISNKSTVSSYAIFDYNNDEKDDLIFTHWNKYVELLENVENDKDFNSLWNLAQIYDLWSTDTVKWWDFTWDWYDDIVFVNNQWKLFLLNNVNKDFTRYDISNYTTWKIIRLEVADMDKDNITDIIILDEMWFVKVLYGLWNSINPKFEVEIAWNAGRPSLNGWSRTDKWALYYDWLVTLGEAWDNSDLIKESEAFQEAIQTNVENLWDYEWNWVNTDILDQLLFVKIPYKPGWVTVWNNNQWSQSGTSQDLINSINIPTSPETENGINNSISSLTNLLSNNQNVFTYPNVNPEVAESDFMKSEYVEVLDVIVDKSYNGDLVWWWNVNFTLNITNDSDKLLSNIAYVEDIPVLFTLDETTVSISDQDAVIRYDIPWYNFLIDNFSLAPWETINVSAKLKTAPIKYGHIQVWLFQEPWSKEDGFLDIVYSASHQNCWETKTIFESCATDKNKNNKNDCQESNIVKPWFNQTTNTPKCNDEKIGLPEEVSQNVTDNDWNGIPDYIDELTSASSSEQSSYAQSIKDKLALDADWDGVPDNEDLTDSSKDFLSNLDEIEDNVDHILAGVDNLIQWFSCWFGGGWCIATPLNWAPLAPWGDPTLFWTPIWDGLNIDEWIPVFSSLTWMWYGPYCLPAVWPISPLSEWCSNTWAGWYLWVDSPSNFFRLYATPTLTGWFWVAACFGWPARVAWYSNMPWLHPLLPWGNCIVTAMPLSSCSNDWSDWDPWSVWFSQVGWGWSWWGSTWGPWFGIFNANCTWDKWQKKDVDLELVQEYLDYKTSWNKTESFEDRFKESFTKISDPNGSNNYPQLNEPLVSFNWESLDDELAVNIDFWEIKAWNFADVIQVQNRRISAFPDFLMWWVTRQIEEIVNKLTDFPTVFIILPDFSWVLDFWEPEDPENIDDTITADENITWLVWSWNLTSVNSGIKEAYSFLSNIPLIKFEQETLAVEIPWVDWNEVAATQKKWEASLQQWKDEIIRARDAWTFGASCWENHPDMSQEECEKANAAAEKVMLQTDALIWSMEQNLEVIKTYKDFPKKLNKLVKKKEDYLEQILCNVESISEILWWWIGRNGERFKAWVELYILIKAILKSWQLLIDVFVDYEAECYECKNERWDLMTFIWKIISAVIPQIPVIQFPKWPDIIMDLHNIRAGLTISLPEFTFGTRPILLPNLPNLYLPDVPTVSINLPAIPVLPTIEIPELPDLPVLPTVELPNLPPPPTLPKMFASLEWILEILKAITKAMCILKTSPFVPEWRAGDQIAFLTERQGYLPTDFIDLSMPQFSFPFVDAIKVTTFVNLEFETDFVTELARQITMPLTTFSNDFTQILNLWVDDLDFSQVPSHIDINIWADGAEWEISYSQQDLATWFAVYLSKWIWDLVSYLDENKNITVSNSEFKILVSQALASDVFVSHPKYSSFRNVWDQVFEYNFEKEDTFIAELKKNNFDKFETVKDILHTEILKNKDLENNLAKYIEPSFITKVDSTINSNVEVYNTQLDKYNKKFIESARELVQPWWNTMVKELEERWEALKAKIWSISNTNVFASGNWWNSWAVNQCQEQANSAYRYNYKWIYVVEPVGDKDYSYLLFDYLDDLDGKEKINHLDSDNDWDKDVIYMMNWEIFIKENLTNTNHTPWNDIKVISTDNNPFYNWNIFYNAVNNFREGIIDNNVINADFSSSTNKNINNYRMTLSRLIDRSTQRKMIIDWFTDIEESRFIKENELFSFWKSLAYIKNIWKFKDIVLTTKELINIKDDLADGNIVDISAGTKVYAWNQAFRLSYMIDWSTDNQVIVVNKNQFIELKSSIKVIWISWDAYIEGRYDITLRSEEIRAYKWLPLSLWSQLEYVWNIDSIDPMTYVEINYYDESEALLNFSFIEKYWLYDLWNKQDRLAISVNMDNDYLYAYIQWFAENIFSTESNQILLSPQKEADNIAPELFLPGIKIPVYQKQVINLWDMIYEDGGIKWIKSIIIDMDLESDSNNDWNMTNDQDITQESITHNSLELNVTFGPYDYLVKKEIWITLIDENNNSSYSQIPFEIYSPRPEIETINELGLIWVIDEELDDEPVSLYRYRGWVISKLKNDDGTNKTWTQWWDYNFKVDEDNSWLTLEYWDTLIAEISENTWKIDLKDFSSRIKVFASNTTNNDSYYPKLEVHKAGNSIYYQYLQVSEWKTIKLVENFENVNNSGLYVNMTDLNSFGYYQIPQTVSYNPWAFVIYRLSNTNKQPLFIIYPDGKIETLNDYYTLEYNYENEYIVLNLIDKNYNSEVAQLLFSIDGWYIMK